MENFWQVQNFPTGISDGRGRGMVTSGLLVTFVAGLGHEGKFGIEGKPNLNSAEGGSELNLDRADDGRKSYLGSPAGGSKPHFGSVGGGGKADCEPYL